MSPGRVKRIDLPAEVDPPVIPTDDDPINHMTYEYHEIFGLDERGWWAINEIGLDRYELTEARAKHFHNLFTLISEAKRALYSLRKRGYVPRNSEDRKKVERAIGEMKKAFQPGAPYISMLRANGLDKAVDKLEADFRALPFR